jgi:dephospho-CoA kinase
LTRTLAVGITGGIGAGKSEVCRFFASFGARVIEADGLAKVLMEKDEKLALSIRKEFGSVYLPGGRLDAKKLASAVFSDSTKLKLLNSLVHPAVISCIVSEIASARSSGAVPVIAVEAALIFEADMAQYFDYTVVVQAPASLQTERVMRRDGASKEDVLRRIGAQMPGEEKSEMADFTIVNTGSLESLRGKCAFVWSILRSLSGNEI